MWVTIHIPPHLGARFGINLLNLNPFAHFKYKKMNTFAFFNSFLIALVLLTFFSCNDTPIDTGEPQFNIELFEQNIIDGITGQVPGYAYVINQNQTLYSKGAEGFANEASAAPFTVDLRMHVASISKVITATAVLKILASRPDVGVDSTIAPYLPNHWVLGQNVENLTFRNLLTHKTGFFVSSGGGYYNDLQVLIEGGLDESLRGNVHEYYNDNFSLFRIIIPILTGELTTNVFEVDAATLALEYVQFVNEELFEPMGISQAYCFQQSSNPIKYYGCDNGAINNGGDQTLRCGAYGWHLSAVDLAAFMAHLRYNNSILDASTRQLMDDDILGWENEKSSNNGEHGTYLFHSGQWHYGGADGGGLETCVMKFAENKVEVSLLFNCVDHPDPNLASPRRLLREAYDNAWE